MVRVDRNAVSGSVANERRSHSVVTNSASTLDKPLSLETTTEFVHDGADIGNLRVILLALAPRSKAS